LDIRFATFLSTNHFNCLFSALSILLSKTNYIALKASFTNCSTVKPLCVATSFINTFSAAARWYPSATSAYNASSRAVLCGAVITAPVPHNTAREEALYALVALGYQRAAAEKVLMKLVATQSGLTVEQLVKEALRAM